MQDTELSDMANLSPGVSPSGRPSCNNTGSSARTSISNDSGNPSEASKHNANSWLEEQKKYLRRLRETAQYMSRDPKFWSPRLGDQKHLVGLDSTSDGPVDWELAGVTVRQPMLRICNPNASINDIELTIKGSDCGAIVLADPTLQQLCAMRHRLKSQVAGSDLKPEFLMEHLTAKRKPTFSQDAGFMCSVDGWAVKPEHGPLEILLEQPKDQKEAVLANALIRVTCYSVQKSLFLVLVRVPDEPLLKRPQEITAAIPVSGWDTFHKSPERSKGDLANHLARCIGDFFSEEWSCRRIRDLWTTTPQIHRDSSIYEMRSCAFLWVMALQGFGRKIDHLTSQIQTFDYEQFRFTSSKTLSKIKEYRTGVARVRQDIACYRNFVRINGLVECYQICHEKSISKNPEYQAKKLNTARQRASVSFDEEYDWLDGKARDAMPLLNQNLQLILASISVEDAAVNKKNGERSIIFAGLATFYLPLSLATSVFGMKIREMDAEALHNLRSFAKLAAVLFSVTIIVVLLSFYSHSLMEAIAKLRGYLKRRVECFSNKAVETQHDGVEDRLLTPPR